MTAGKARLPRRGLASICVPRPRPLASCTAVLLSAPTVYLRLLLLSAIWGASFLFMRILVPSIGTVPAAFSRVLLATVGLAVILMSLGVRWNFRNRLRPTLVLGIINSGIPFLMYSFAAGLLATRRSSMQ